MERPLNEDLLGALKFLLAFYEPGQRYLDTVAWTNACAGAVAAHNRGVKELGWETPLLVAHNGEVRKITTE